VASGDPRSLTRESVVGVVRSRARLAVREVHRVIGEARTDQRHECEVLTVSLCTLFDNVSNRGVVPDGAARCVTMPAGDRAALRRVVPGHVTGVFVAKSHAVREVVPDEISREVHRSLRFVSRLPDAE
jgi:hypothetical protein